MKGNCSLLKELQPLSCPKSPIVFHGEFLTSWLQNSVVASLGFELHIRNAWKKLRYIKIPKHFTLQVPGTEYSYGQTMVDKILFKIIGELAQLFFKVM